MMLLVAGVAMGLVVLLFIVARRLHDERQRAVRASSRLAAVLESYSAGMSVWTTEGHLIACNRRFQEFYSGVELQPGLPFEDLIRFTATRGLIQLPESQVDTWVRERLERFGEAIREVFPMADGRWLESQSISTDHGEVVLLYVDCTALRDAESALTERNQCIEQKVTNLIMLQRAVEIGGEAVSVEMATQQVLKLICEWSGWTVGYAYRVTKHDADSERLDSMRLWHCTTPGSFSLLHAVTDKEHQLAGESISGRAHQSGDVVWVSNIGVDPAITSARRVLMPGILGACAVPVTSSGRVHAVLEFLSRDQLSPNPSTTRLLQNVTRALGWVFDRHDRP